MNIYTDYWPPILIIFHELYTNHYSLISKVLLFLHRVFYFDTALYVVNSRDCYFQSNMAFLTEDQFTALQLLLKVCNRIYHQLLIHMRFVSFCWLDLIVVHSATMYYWFRLRLKMLCGRFAQRVTQPEPPSASL